jgi:ribonucleoside-diphosphate reductase alpha chain
MDFTQNMRVKKRCGDTEIMSFDKILKRLTNLSSDPQLTINITSIAIKVIDQLVDNISTYDIDILSAEYCQTLSSVHTDYGILASKILISNNHKSTSTNFLDTCIRLHSITTPDEFSLLDDTFMENVSVNHERYQGMLDYSRDYSFDYFGFKTLETSYLIKKNGKVVERPQHLFLRVSIFIHMKNSVYLADSDFDKIQETYDLLSMKYMIHATPTLFYAGTKNPQLSSCFLVGMQDDSVDGIFDTMKDCAIISKYSGGIGLHVHNIRGNNSVIRGTNGISRGICPMLRVFNNMARFINQSGKRNSSCAIYLEPWHLDIEPFLDLKTNHGDEEAKARDLFYGLWVCDLFMKRIETDAQWTLMCPDTFKGLSDVYGDDFNVLYESYEEQIAKGEIAPGPFKVMKARDLWYKILDTIMETGTPYITFKDSVNNKTNQKNIGIIRSSNLCTEIMQYSDKDQTAVCNLASIALPTFVDETTKEFDYGKLHYVSKVLTQNLNNIIDINFYPTEKSKVSNFAHRPIGIGVQGLADAFIKMDIAFHSDEALEVNKKIFETIYHGALEKSNELAQLNGSYESFVGSPASEGILQFDMWGIEPSSERYNWSVMKDNIIQFGLRNSLLLAPMPTASTSQILGFNECFEPFTSNIYSRGTHAGEFVITNKYLIKELLSLGVWDETVKNSIIQNKGSIQHLTFLPKHILQKYKIVWEIPMKHIIEMSADRGAYICQSQSLNLWVEDPNYKILTSMLFYSWKKGLKTGMYYLRRKAKHTAQQFTIEPPSCITCSA